MSHQLYVKAHTGRTVVKSLSLAVFNNQSKNDCVIKPLCMRHNSLPATKSVPNSESKLW